jgi:hypothetical protein
MLESCAAIAIVAAVVGFFLWRERQDEKHGRKQPSDAGGSVADTGTWWYSGWGGDSCGGSDGGGCGGD